MRNLITFLLIFINVNLFSQTPQLFKAGMLPQSGESKLRLLNNGSSNEKENTLIQSLPTIITGSTPFRVIPDVDIIAANQKKSDNGGRVHNLKIFTSAVSFDTTRLQNGFNFLVSNASKVGFQYQYSYVFLLNRTSTDTVPLFFNVSANFLGKEVPQVDANGMTSGGDNVLVFHSKVGLEYLFLKDFLSIFANANFLRPITGVQEFNDYFNISESKSYWYADLGFRAQFFLGNDKSSSFTLDLSLINIAGDISPFVNQSDLALPMIKISFNKLFSLSNNNLRTDSDQRMPKKNN